MMRITKSCEQCLLRRQKNLTDHEPYLAEITHILENRAEDDSAPYMVYLFHKIYERYFGQTVSYAAEKKKYNDLMLSVEETIRSRIEASTEPLQTALMYARVGNYIDFGAMDQVEEGVLLSLFEQAQLSEKDRSVMDSFITQCRKAKNFLLITDNCGEIVLDKLFLEQLSRQFPQLRISALVRGGEVINDATEEDAAYVGLDRYAGVVSSGRPIAGTVYEMLSEDAKEVFDQAEVILAKGQGNYESLSRQGRHIFYAFLCKCELFTSRFGVPEFTGIFTEE